jgi:hypothetical protein
MGTVYLARDTADRYVAVKLIHPDLSDDPDFRSRFAREVASARRVARFSTAGVIDARLDGDPLFIVSEYVPGPNLAQAIAADGPMDGGTLESLAMGVAAALTAIHRAGVIHRDLKPANVLLSTVGPKVIDFGIARAMDDDGSVTRSSQLMGTPAYLAPELILGESVRPASDIFSWGCLVAFAGTGRAPFDAPTVPAVLHRISSAEPVLDGLDPRLHDLVAAALDKNPANRPTAQGVLNRLVGQEDPPAATVDETVVRSWTPPSTARPAPGTLAAGAAGGAAAGAGAASGAAGGPPAAEPTAGLAADPVRGTPPPTGGQPPLTGAQPPSTRPMGPYGSVPPTGGQPAFGQVPSGPQPGYAPAGPGGHRYGPYNVPSGPQPGHAKGGPPSPPFGGPSFAPGGPGGGAPSPAPKRRRALLLVGGAAAAVLLLVAAAAFGLDRLLTPAVPDGTEIYASDFSTLGEWNLDAYDPADTTSGGGYRDQRLLLIVQSDSAEPSRGETAPFGDTEPIPQNVLVRTDAYVESGPDYGEFGVRCYRQEDGEGVVTMYEGLVRFDGGGAVIRRVGGASGDSELASTTEVPGFESRPEDGEAVANDIALSCQADPAAGTMTLSMWVNEEHVLEAVDDRLLPDDAADEDDDIVVRQVGVVAKRGGGGGDDAAVAFDDFSLQELQPTSGASSPAEADAS